jgi:hypothetical protein
MLLKTGVISSNQKAFGLFRDPFADEAMQGAEDVFTTPDIRYVREALFRPPVLAAFWRLSASPARVNPRCAAT